MTGIVCLCSFVLIFFSSGVVMNGCDGQVFFGSVMNQAMIYMSLKCII